MTPKKSQPITFLCNNCGDSFAKWFGKCPSCHEWKSLVEYRVPKPIPSASRRSGRGSVASQGLGIPGRSRREGREKQIGHAVLLQDGQPLSEPDELARRFRQEILPLLQEYCYDEYEALADLIGDKLVDRESQTLRQEVLSDNEKLLSVLESEFSHDTSTSPE